MHMLFKIWLLLSALGSIYFKLGNAGNVQKINNYLVNHLDTDEPKANLQVAFKMFDEELKKNSLFSRGLIADLRKFISLDKIRDGNRCNRNSHLILLTIDEATGGRAHEKGAPTRRIDKIVRDFAQLHAEDCRDVYPTNYYKVYGQMEEYLVGCVQTFIDGIIESRQLVPANIKEYSIIYEDNNEKLWDKYFSTSGRIAYDSIRFMARNDPNQIFSSGISELDANHSEEEMRVSFEKYLVQPCKYYLIELGPDIFLPAKYDNVLHQDEPEDYMRRDFYYAWARFRLCEAFINHDHESLLKDVITTAYS